MKNKNKNKNKIIAIFAFPCLFYSSVNVAGIISEKYNESLFNCMFLNQDGAWRPDEKIKTSTDCKAKDKRINGIAYSWQKIISDIERDSTMGVCLVQQNENDGTYSHQYNASKIGCENHNAKSDKSHHWKEFSGPIFYVMENQRGYGEIKKESIPNFLNYDLIRSLIKSYYLPEPWNIKMCSEENFEGNCDLRNWNDSIDQYKYNGLKEIKSIKVWKDTNPIHSAKELFFGESIEINSCGQQARVLNASDVESAKLNECKNFMGKWQINRIEEDGFHYEFMGYGYHCKRKLAVSNTIPALCTMNTIPELDSVFLFRGENFAGNVNGDGKAIILNDSQSLNDTLVKSFKLSQNTQINGFSEKNFSGAETIYTESKENLEHPILSLRVIKTVARLK